MKKKTINTTNKAWRVLFSILFVLAFVAAGLIVAQIQGKIDITKVFNVDAPETPTLTKGVINRVIDGDTYEVYVDGYLKKVRLIGVDTPESVHPDNSKNTEEGIKVSEQVKKMLPEGTTVYLEYETQLVDVYNRDLVDMWTAPVDLNNIDANNIGNLFNFQLVAQGYANVATYPPNEKYVNWLNGAKGINEN